MKRLVSSRPYVIRGASMTPSLRPGDQVLVDVSAYGSPKPARGDIVVFSSPGADGRHDIKRVVGAPGERVVMADGVLYVDDREFNKPYLGGLPSSVGLGDVEWELGAGEYLVLGDNRAHSTDSREFGPIGADRIVGRAWLRYWPLTAWGTVHPR
jgi:signal peptidase I